MSSAGLHDPFFRVVTAPAFSRQHIADLASGRCAVLRVPELLSEATCAQLVDCLLTADFDSYGRERVQPAVMRFGVGVSDHRTEGGIADTYWPALEAARRAWRSLPLPFDPLEAARRALTSDWPGRSGIARHRGRELGPGVAREAPQGFLVHFDDAVREFPASLLDDPPVAQLAFNLYLAMPETGGETVVWRHRWHPADEAFRPLNSYGFTEECVQGAEELEIKPAVGEALLFDSRNYHAVRPGSPGRRITLGFSVGLTAHGELLAWG